MVLSWACPALQVEDDFGQGGLGVLLLPPADVKLVSRRPKGACHSVLLDGFLEKHVQVRGNNEVHSTTTVR